MAPSAELVNTVRLKLAQLATSESLAVQTMYFSWKKEGEKTLSQIDRTGVASLNRPLRDPARRSRKALPRSP